MLNSNLLISSLWGGVLLIFLFFLSAFTVFVIRFFEYYVKKFKALNSPQQTAPIKVKGTFPVKKAKPVKKRAEKSIFIDPDTVSKIYVGKN